MQRRNYITHAKLMLDIAKHRPSFTALAKCFFLFFIFLYKQINVFKKNCIAKRGYHHVVFV